MSTQTKTKGPKQNLVNLIRRVRKLLPGEVVKKSLVEYEVNDRALITFNYYCTWDPKKQAKDAKECHPHSITVKPITRLLKEGHNHVQPRAVCGTVTISKLKDGDFNLERVAVAVTKCCEAVDRFAARRKEAHRKSELQRAKLRRMVDDLVKSLPLGFVGANRSNYAEFPGDQDMRVQVAAIGGWGDDEEYDEEVPVDAAYNFSIEGISKELAVTLARECVGWLTLHKQATADEEADGEDCDYLTRH